ncbi:hypothetical protein CHINAEXTREME_17245 [Halobiforma lacisalsi AJ5]|uniref:Uncharacterized protein n=1 Tax=Natronobacterium lacisalsi AJ5 TaxID=358396 RepID=M0LT46_NATLA|nr:hypothetical protein [Halobiforma lacisalsi]APW99408.1 hypothetical protein CHINAEXTREME_17245 [Halobiforma lacisalsi AJ5]EMA35290.1 hypothetical protein C445_05538 [Halobiforma lacisalsi AJ5]
MTVPRFDNYEEEAVALLRQIAANTGAIDDVGGGSSPSTPQTGTSGPANDRMSPEEYIVIETAALEEANPDGTVTIEPGETVTLAEYESRAAGSFSLLAAGASEHMDVAYRLVADDDRVVGGTTYSPLGSINDPFSFPKMYDTELQVSDLIEYQATLSPNAEGTVDAAARLHLRR